MNTRRRKLHDPKVIRSPACDRQMDRQMEMHALMLMSHSSIAEHDKN